MANTVGYAEIAANYRKQIQDGVLKPGDRVERTIASRGLRREVRVRPWRLAALGVVSSGMATPRQEGRGVRVADALSTHQVHEPNGPRPGG